MAFFLLLLAGIWSPYTSSVYGVSDGIQTNDEYELSQSSDILTVPTFPDAFDYEINIVFLGINESRINSADLLDDLPAWYAPLDGMVPEIIFDINFTISYNLIFSDQTDIADYNDFLTLNSEENLAPMFIQPEHSVADYIHVSTVEDYLIQNFMDDATPTLVIIDRYTYDPSNHEPYYYNATYNELDAEIEGWTTNPIPWASTYHFAGGGEDARLLWLDLSAGPTEYQFWDDGTTVAAEEVTRIWDYSEPSVSQLTQDLVKYIALSVECRYLASNFFLAGYAYEEVKFEVLLVDLAESDFAFEERLKLDYMVSEYSRVIPFIDWTYSVSEWNWQEDALFQAILESSRYGSTQTYNPERLMNYWDSIYTNFFNQTTKQRFVIPIFLVMTPSGWSFDPDYGGFARNVDGVFAYIYGKQNENMVDPSARDPLVSPLNGIVIESGEFFNVSGESGDYIQEFNLTIDYQNDTVSLYLLDDYNYNQYKDGLAFTDLFGKVLENVTSISEIRSAVVDLEVYGAYHFIIENNGTESVSINCTVTIASDFSVGYTWKIMHETGHAMGLNHPHYGFSWGNYDHPDAEYNDYVNFLWDMTYSQMNYANQAPTISKMDIDILQRECIPRYWQDAIQNLTVLLENVTTLSAEARTHLENSIALFDDSVSFYADTSTSENYNKSLEAVFQMWDSIHLAGITPTTAELPLLLIIGTTGIIAVCAIAVGFGVMRRRKK